MNRSNIAENIMQTPDLEPRREVLLVQSCCFAQCRVADLVWSLNTVKPTKVPVGQVMVDDEMFPGSTYIGK